MSVTGSVTTARTTSADSISSRAAGVRCAAIWMPVPTTVSEPRLTARLRPDPDPDPGHALGRPFGRQLLAHCVAAAGLERRLIGGSKAGGVDDRGGILDPLGFEARVGLEFLHELRERA